MPINETGPTGDQEEEGGAAWTLIENWTISSACRFQQLLFGYRLCDFGPHGCC